MRFEKLNEMIPYVTGGKKHILTMSPYNGITLAMPGRHQKDTPAPGADFVVMVDDENKEWVKHQFTHTDIFEDLQAKYNDVPNATYGLVQNYFDVVMGVDPTKVEREFTDGIFMNLGIHPDTFLCAVQCLAVAEHRRYAKYEDKFGGRYLPFRFAAGIAEGLWSAKAAIGMQRRGRPGVEILEKVNGIPKLTKELING